MKDKVLIVSWTLHPWPTGSSVIVNNIASQFSQDELVLLGEECLDFDASSWPKEYPKIYYVNPNIKIFGKGQSLFRWINIRRVINKIISIIEKEKVTKVLGIYPDDFYLYATYVASKKVGIPMYTWFHNTYFDNVSGYKKIFAKWFQPKVFKHAVVNFVMSEGMSEFLRESYPSHSFKTLVHGFPLPALPEPQKLNGQRRIKFLFTGNLNESCREASVRLLKTILSSPNYEVHAYTGTTEKEFEAHGIAGENFVVKGFIPLDRLYYKQQEYDILLLPHGFDGRRTQVEYDTIFPTRTIPYLISKRPILAHSPKGVFLTRFLEDQKCALNIQTKSSEEILDGIDELLTNPECVDSLVKNALKTSEMFRVSDVVNELIETIES